MAGMEAVRGRDGGGGGDATLLAIKQREDGGIDIVYDGEQSRQHFVHGFLANIEGIDFDRRVEMGIRNVQDCCA
jgi:5-methyltetrahydropteroyltriglutamate--homocysteine methyltransferase